MSKTEQPLSGAEFDSVEIPGVGVLRFGIPPPTDPDNKVSDLDRLVTENRGVIAAMNVDAKLEALSGAEFQREVGADPEKWAKRLYDAMEMQGEALRSEADRVAFLAGWLRDAMDAAAKQRSGSE